MKHVAIRSALVAATLASSVLSLPTRAEDAHQHPPQNAPAPTEAPTGPGSTPASPPSSGSPAQHAPPQPAQSQGHQHGQGPSAGTAMMMDCPMMQSHAQQGSGNPAAPSGQGTPSSQGMGTMMQGMGMMMQGMGMMMQGMGTMQQNQARPSHQHPH
jgi:hypothetical protein